MLALCVSHLVKQYPVLADLAAVMIAIWKLFKFYAHIFAVRVVSWPFVGPSSNPRIHPPLLNPDVKPKVCLC